MQHTRNDIDNEENLSFVYEQVRIMIENEIFQSQPICDDFGEAGFGFFLVNNGITIFIIVVNMILTEVTINRVS